MSHALMCRCEDCILSGVRWTPMREGSNFEVPQNSQNGLGFWITWENNVSKKSRNRALAKAFLRARLGTEHTYDHAAVRWDLSRAAHHFAWLEYRAR